MEVEILPEVGRLRQCIEACLKNDDVAPYYSALRESRVAYLPCTAPNDLGPVHRACCQLLFAIGSVCPAAAYAVENHLYWLGALATYLQWGDGASSAGTLSRFLAEVASGRLLVANTSTYVHAERAFTKGVKLVAAADGGRLLEGKGGFASLASYADRLLLIAEIDGKSSLYALPTKADKTIQFGDLSFPDMMVESDTRGVAFERTRLSEAARLHVAAEQFLPAGRLTACTDIWHFTLTAALFTGAAMGAIEEATQFAKQFKSADGRELARLDGVVATIGQMGVSVAAARAFLFDISRCLDTIDRNTGADDLYRIVSRCRAANWFCTTTAENVVRTARGLVGTRIYTGHHRLDRLTREVAVGPMVPRSNVLLEREVGYFVFGEGPAL